MFAQKLPLVFPSAGSVSSTTAGTWPHASVTLTFTAKLALFAPQFVTFVKIPIDSPGDTVPDDSMMSAVAHLSAAVLSAACPNIGKVTCSWYDLRYIFLFAIVLSAAYLLPL